MPIFCSGGKHHLCLQKLFATQISLKRHSRAKDGSCLCSQDMQKYEKHGKLSSRCAKLSVTRTEAKEAGPQPSDYPVKGDQLASVGL